MDILAQNHSDSVYTACSSELEPVSAANAGMKLRRTAMSRWVGAIHQNSRLLRYQS